MKNKPENAKPPQEQLRSPLPLALGILLVAAVGVGLLIYFLGKPPASPIDARQVVEAVARFRVERRPLPETVTFSQLIAQGFLAPDMLEKFGAAEVTVYLKSDSARPESFLMDAQMADGTHVTLLSDGSVQQFTPGRQSTNAVSRTNGVPTGARR